MKKILKTFIRAAVLVGGVGAMQAVGGPAHAQESLRVMSFGGSYQDAQRKAQFQPFEQATGIKIVESTWFADIGKVKAMVESGNVTADIVLGDVAHAILGCNEGFLVPFDTDAFGDPKDYIPGTMWECGIPTELVSIIYAYNEDRIPAAWGDRRPKTIADLFDTEKFPGKRAFSVRALGGLIEKVLLAEGVPPDQVYEVLGGPGGFDRVLAKLEKMKGDIVFYTSNAQPLQLLADGEVALIQSSNGRIYSAIANEKKKFVPVWDGQVYYPDVWFIPKGGNKELATKFLKFITEPKNMAALTNYIPYAPVRYSAEPFVNEQMKPYLTTSHDMKSGVVSDMMWWSEHEAEINERLQAWLAKK